MDRSERFYADYLNDNTKGKLRDVVNHDCADSTERIADYTGISDFVTTISTACSSSANALMLGAQMIKAGMIDRVVAGGADPVTRFTLNGFNTLMILDRSGCKPFDEHRAGLTIGEGAAFVVLESEAMIAKSGKKADCRTYRLRQCQRCIPSNRIFTGRHRSYPCHAGSADNERTQAGRDTIHQCAWHGYTQQRPFRRCCHREGFW